MGLEMVQGHWLAGTWAWQEAELGGPGIPVTAWEQASPAETSLELESPEQAEVPCWVTGKPLSTGEPGHRRPRGLCGTPAAPLSQDGGHTGGLKDGRRVQSTVQPLHPTLTVPSGATSSYNSSHQGVRAGGFLYRETCPVHRLQC